MKFRIVLASVAAFALAVPALAADKDDSQSQDAPKEKKICRTETVTGSLIAKRRICKTQAEWDQLAAETRKNVDDLSRTEGLGNETGSGSGANSNPLVN